MRHFLMMRNGLQNIFEDNGEFPMLKSIVCRAKAYSNQTRNLLTESAKKEISLGFSIMVMLLQLVVYGLLYWMVLTFVTENITSPTKQYPSIEEILRI